MIGRMADVIETGSEPSQKVRKCPHPFISCATQASLLLQKAVSFRLICRKIDCNDGNFNSGGNQKRGSGMPAWWVSAEFSSLAAFL